MYHRGRGILIDSIHTESAQIRYFYYAITTQNLFVAKAFAISMG